MNDLQLVAILELGFLPFLASDDLEIELHGYAIRLHSQMIDERGKSEAVGKVAGFAVELEMHCLEHLTAHDADHNELR